MNGIGSTVGGGYWNLTKPAWLVTIPGMAWMALVIVCRLSDGMVVWCLRKWVATSSPTYENWYVVHTTNGYPRNWTNGLISMVTCTNWTTIP